MSRPIRVVLLLIVVACISFQAAARNGDEGCPPMFPNENVLIQYQCPSGSSCAAGDQIVFNATGVNYSFACDAHSFLWNFGDGTFASGETVTHTFAAAGTYNISLAIANSKQQVTVNASATITAPPTSCPTITQNNVFIGFNGASSGCTPAGGECRENELIAFQPMAFGYSFSCSVHTFTWNFGDGSATVSGFNVTHVYETEGTPTVTLQIATPSQTVTLQQTVHVLGGDPPIVDWFDFVAQPLIVDGVPVQNGYVFVAASQPAPVTTWNWDFGDGVTVTGSGTQTHIYADGGVHIVTLRIPGLPGVVKHPFGTAKRRAARH